MILGIVSRYDNVKRKKDGDFIWLALFPWWLISGNEPGFYPWVGKIPWRREWLYIPVLLPGKFHGQRSLVGYTGGKELDVTDQLPFSLSW